MNLQTGVGIQGRRFSITWRHAILLMLLGLAFAPRVQAARLVTLWDTSSSLASTFDVSKRNSWSLVPTDLAMLEAEPEKARSDPGYYGREYAFHGDAMVENQSLIAVFHAGSGRVILFSKLPGADSVAQLITEFTPLQMKGHSSTIQRCDIIRNGGDDVVIEATFAAEGMISVTAAFVFDKTGIVEIQPGPGLKGFQLKSPIQYGVVPHFVGDDMVLGPDEFALASTLHVSANQSFMGLMDDGNRQWLLTWPEGHQQLRLNVDTRKDGQGSVESLEFDNDGKSFYLGLMEAPNLWHVETLVPSFLEKDIAISWKTPFPAKWKTQLLEAGVNTTFAFRNSKGHVWRGVPGSYEYPVWFDAGQAFFHLSKKVPPRGEALVYFLEGNGTPREMATPADIIKATLGRQASAPVLDAAGRKLRTHHRRTESDVHRACTCGYTEAIQAVFESGEEVASRDYIELALDDMIHFVRLHVERIEEYQRFAQGMNSFLKAKQRATPELKPYLESLRVIALRIPEEYSVQKDNMKSLVFAAELSRQTMALTRKKDAGNLKIYMALFKDWRAMGGAQDYVLAQCHMITRQLFQAAGHGALTQPEAVVLAVEIQSRCRRILRNPDGYEIWTDY